MKLEGLRVGNYVSPKDTTRKVGIVSFNVAGFLENGIRINDWGITKLDLLDPIAITEEWLFKFGFEKSLGLTDNNTTYRRGEVEIVCVNGDFFPVHLYSGFTSQPVGNSINFVHQLQNVYFDLTGEDLVIKH